MGKFKVGDKVRILDGSKLKNYAGGWYEETMKEYVGTINTISSIYKFSNGKIDYRCYGTCGYVFDERGLERFVNETIVIYRKGNETIAFNKETGKKAIAKCSLEDTFDFNVGAKLAFDRLMNGNKESIAVEDMRKRLKSYCAGRLCFDCKLKFPTCRCGHGAHFMTKDDAGNYTMSNKEIKDAFNTVFGTGVREVKRRSGKECKTKEPHKFKVGDIVKGNSESNDRYCITNSNMTRGKVISVLKNGDISIKVLSHKTMPDEVGEKFVCAAKYFDLVEESPKLYNGKIIFTKGDDTFKTGRVYEVNDGRVIAPAYGSLPLIEPFKDIEDVKDYFTGNLDGNRKREKGWSPYTLELMEVIED